MKKPFETETQTQTLPTNDDELRVVVRRERRLRTDIRAGEITTRPRTGGGGECGSA